MVAFVLFFSRHLLRQPRKTIHRESNGRPCCSVMDEKGKKVGMTRPRKRDDRPPARGIPLPRGFVLSYLTIVIPL
jgi:hypothetical protein